MEWLRSVKRQLYPITSRYMSRATLVEGMLSGAKEPFRCLFVGNDLAGYLCKEAYIPHPRILRKQRIWLPGLRRLISRYSSSIDMCIALLPMDYESIVHNDYSFKTQELIEQRLDTSECWENIRSKFRKNLKETERRIKKHNLTYRTSCNIDDFNMFYYDMYLPHIKRQFSGFATIDSYEEMRSFFLRGFLLIISESKNDMAAALCLTQDDTLHFRRTGVLHNESDYDTNAARSAIYYFLIRFAEDNNLKQVNLMASRPFLNDGVYRKKREWGAAVYADDEAEACIYFFIPKFSEKIVEFFSNNPAIVHFQDGLYGLVGWKNPCDVAISSEQELVHRFSSPGLKGLLLLDNNGKTKTLPFNLQAAQE